MKIKAQHILVNHEYIVHDLLKKLSDGVSFEVLARDFSEMVCVYLPVWKRMCHVLKLYWGNVVAAHELKRTSTVGVAGYPHRERGLKK